jgi:L-amino acid N-acyltransferase YncA
MNVETAASAGSDVTVVRPAGNADFSAITAIYAHHVLNGLGSFEIDPPDEAEMRRRYAEVIERGLPYLVAERGGAIAGYAYAAPYRARPAYRFTVEDSVYVSHDHLGRGIGRALLDALVAECERAGCRQMIAVIGDSGNRASIALHQRCGFSDAGLLPATGFKAGRWVDVVLMQRALGEGGRSLPAGRL